VNAQQVAGFLARRFRGTLAAVVAVTVVLGAGATRLYFDTSQNGLIGAQSQVAKDNVRYQATFGGDALLIMATGPVAKLFTPHNLARQRRLEAQLQATGQFSSVIGPYDTLEFAANQTKVGQAIFADAIAQANARGDTTTAAKVAAVQRIELSRATPLVTSGQLSLSDPAASLSDPAVVQYLLRDQTGAIRPALRDAFPNNDHAVFIVTPKGNTSIATLGAAADTVTRITAHNPFAGFHSIATGPPVLLEDINNYLQGGLATLGALAIAVMALILCFVFRVRSRLLSLVVVALGAITTFGVMGYLGIALSLVTISGFPIIIGLAVDFSIQVQSRFQEEVSIDGDGTAAMARTFQNLVPALGIAMAAAALGFVAIQVSRVPIIRDFGVMLDLAVVLLFLIVVTALPALLLAREHRRPSPPHEWGRGAIERTVRTVAHAAQRVLLPVMLIGAIVTIAGFAVAGRFSIQTDPQKWVPQGSTVVHDLNELQAGAGFSSEVGTLVEAPNVTTTGVASWMNTYGTRQVTKHSQDLLRATSLPGAVAAVTGGAPVDQTQLQLLLSIAPKVFRTEFISPNHRQANLIFPVRNISLNQREQLLSAMTADLHPPAGTHAVFSGLAVVGVELVKALEANRTELTLLSLLAVVIWLGLAYRSVWKVALPLVPVVFAVGGSSLIVYLLGFSLSPLTAVSAPLVIAVCTEFSVLIMARYLEERARGRTPDEAVDIGAVRIGRAFVASGLTLIGGFGVLAASPFPLLRDFGIIVALNAVVALLSALFILPPLLMWADRHGHLPRLGPDPTDQAGDAAGVPPEAAAVRA
jgi:hydrophobe/amphiphile efflux-3 (HAE3) family protein